MSVQTVNILYQKNRTTIFRFIFFPASNAYLFFVVRQKAKDVTALLNDDARLKEERRSRQHMRERMAGVGDYMNETLYGRSGPPDGSVYERPGYLDEDRDLQRAMEESRRMARDEARNREQR